MRAPPSSQTWDRGKRPLDYYCYHSSIMDANIVYSYVYLLVRRCGVVVRILDLGDIGVDRCIYAVLSVGDVCLTTCCARARSIDTGKVTSTTVWQSRRNSFPITVSWSPGECVTLESSGCGKIPTLLYSIPRFLISLPRFLISLPEHRVPCQITHYSM